MPHESYRMKRLYSLAAVLATLMSSTSFGQSENAISKRATDLRAGPGDTAPSVLAIAAETPLTRLPTRQGAWVQVRTASGQIGWIHMFDLGSASAPAAPSNAATGALRGLTNFFTRGSPTAKTTTATSTIGIRGLGAEDIAQAQPNLDGLAQVESFRQDASQARKFAAELSLQARKVDPLPAPTAPQSPNNEPTSK